MGTRSILAILISVLCLPVLARTLDLYTFHAPPYQIEADTRVSDSAVSGTTVDTVHCVTAQMGWDVNIRTVPQNRAMHSLRARFIDGYFAVDEIPELSNIAGASAPIALEKWYFFSLGHIADFKAAHLGTIAGSNEALWLANRGYSNVLPVYSAPQLIELLKRGRVNAIVLDQQVLDQQILDANSRGGSEGLQLQTDGLKKEFIRFAPLHLYLTHNFTSLNPDFLPEFNNLLDGCVTVGFKLSEHEALLARDLAAYLLADLRTQVDLKPNLANHQELRSLSETLNLDRKWQALAPTKPSELAERLLNLAISRALADWQDSHKGLVTETFITNKMGAITALSQLTSDFWQGDEEHFSATIGRRPEEIILSPLMYDPSARRFQLTASTPLYEDGTGKYAGAIAIGLDIERVLQTSNGVSALFQPE